MDIRSSSFNSYFNQTRVYLFTFLPLLLTLTPVLAGSCTNMCKA